MKSPDILKSATKVVLLLVTLTLCYCTIRGIIPAPDFKDIALLVLGAYFGRATATKEEETK